MPLGASKPVRLRNRAAPLLHKVLPMGMDGEFSGKKINSSNGRWLRLSPFAHQCSIELDDSEEKARTHSSRRSSCSPRFYGSEKALFVSRATKVEGERILVPNFVSCFIKDTNSSYYSHSDVQQLLAYYFDAGNIPTKGKKSLEVGRSKLVAI